LQESNEEEEMKKGKDVRIQQEERKNK